MSEKNLPEWEQLLSAAAHLQELLPGATLVGGTAVAIFANHRLSRDADHVLPDLRPLEETNLSEYRNLHPNWQDWNRVRDICEKP